MGLKEAAIPTIFFCVAIFGIAQSAITINAYLTTNKPKDASFNFSIAVMVFSICMLFGGGWDWVADVTGFAFGFLVSFVVSPGGFGRVMDQLRQR